MQVLIADKLPQKYVESLTELGLDVLNEPKLGSEDIPQRATDADIIIVRSTKVTRKAVEAAKNLKLVIRAGAGYNNIDIESCNKKAVAVANCPGKNSIAVAELAMGLLLSLDRRIPEAVADFKKGQWNKAEYSKAEGLYGKTLVIVGVGNIGRELAKRANAFGMKVYGKDIFPVAGCGIEYFENLEEMLPKADAISIHLPLTKETEGMFDDKVFDLMKDGVLFINTSRPQVVNEDALIKAVRTKHIRAGLDVFIDEPEGKTGAVASKLETVDGIYVTHHIGASTAQAQDAVAEEAVRIIKVFKETGTVEHQVNK